MKKTINIAALILFISFAVTSCKKEKVQEQNDNELITTVEVHLTEHGTSNELIYKWEDLEGDGSPIIQDIVLAPGKVYDVSLELFDKTKDPIVNTSEEIEEEAIDHRFYFEPSAGSNITVTTLNNDTNNLPVGLTSTWTTGDAGTGNIRIILRHYESGGKAMDDDVNSSKSSTDTDISFVTKVQL